MVSCSNKVRWIFSSCFTCTWCSQWRPPNCLKFLMIVFLFHCFTLIFTLRKEHRLWEVLWGVIFLHVNSRLHVWGDALYDEEEKKLQMDPGGYSSGCPRTGEQWERINRGSLCQALVAFRVNLCLSLQWLRIPTLSIHQLEQPVDNAKAYGQEAGAASSCIWVQGAIWSRNQNQIQQELPLWLWASCPALCSVPAQVWCR